MYWLLMNMYEVWVVYNYEKHNGAALCSPIVFFI